MFWSVCFLPRWFVLGVRFQELNKQTNSKVPQWLYDSLPGELAGRVRIHPGPRQAGKMTLLLELPERREYIIDIFLAKPNSNALKILGGIGFSYRNPENPDVDSGAISNCCEAVADGIFQ